MRYTTIDSSTGRVKLVRVALEVNKEFCIHKDSTLKFECTGSVMSADFNSVSWTHDLDLGVSKGKFSSIGDESRISIHGEVQKGDTKQVVKLTLNEVRWNPPVSIGGNPYVIGDAPHGEMELLSGQGGSAALGKRAVGASGTKVRVGKENRKRKMHWVQAMEVMPTPKKKTKHASAPQGGGVGPAPQGGGPDSEDDANDATMDVAGGSNDVSGEEDENDDEESGEEGSDEDVEEDEMEVTRGKSTGGKKVQEDGPVVEGYATTVVKSVSYSADVESDVGTLSFAVEDVHNLGFGAQRSGLLATHPDQQAKHLLLEKPIVLFPTKGNCGVAWTLGAVHVVQGKEKIIGFFRNGACDEPGTVSRKAAEHLGIKVGLFDKNMKPVVKQTKKSNVKYGDDRDAVVDLCKLVYGWFKELDSYHQQGRHFFETWADACTQERISDWRNVTKSSVFRKEEFVITGPSRDGSKEIKYPTELFMQWAIQHFRHPPLLSA
jgi:hypothetical protein